ncbi:haloacid dehalogenase type II [Microbacterium marmarense]|uniref:Haloacid dehalogenase type II n=1 Tax=Microbacterium marmarense TaxID=3122051 RepID=A0ABU8LS74_9MICO
MTKVIAFDVNETLLDLRALDPAFEQLLGSAALRGQWFSQMLQLSFVGGLTSQYVDFRTAQRGALAMVAERAGVAISEADVIEMVDRMTSLPPHPEVPAALDQLRKTGLKLVALTNSTGEVADLQLANSGIREFFDDAMSADAVRALKPAPEPYLAVAERFGVDISEVRLVAAHSWDITGALEVGAKAAFIARGGVVPSPIGPQPDIIGADLAEVVGAIIATDL